jgi:molybdopterin biosynthesis enzyme MoaB
MRAESLKKTPFGMISRSIAGVRGRTFIVNFPGSPKAIRETFPVIRPILAHAVQLLAGGVGDCVGLLESSQRRLG